MSSIEVSYVWSVSILHRSVTDLLLSAEEYPLLHPLDGYQSGNITPPLMNTCHGFFYRECHNLTKQYNMSEIFCLLNCLQLDSVVWRLTLMINFQLTILCKGRLQNPACNVSATDRMNNMHSNLSMGHFRGFPALAQLFYQAWYGFFEIASKFV